MKPNWIDLVESVYDVDTPSHDAWLTKLTNECAPFLNPVRRAVGCIFHLEKDALQAFAASGSDADYANRAMALGADRPDFFKRCYRGKAFNTMSGHVGRSQFVRWETYRRNYHSIGEHDALGVVARDGGPWGVCICGGQPRVRAVTRGEAVPWERIAAHIHAALRLRFRLYGAPHLEAAPGPIALRTSIDAVLSPGGKLEHAEPEAQPFADSSIHAAVAIDRARARMRREDPEGALAAWRALVEGEWSLVETFESDGRRFLVARRNAPDAPRAARLTERERVLLGLRARSRVKLIGYELGVSPASVSRALASGMRKLGIASIGDLVRRGEGN